jgi:hypothetical protein
LHLLHQKLVNIAPSLASTAERRGMGLLEYKAKPSLRDIAHVGGLCTFSNIPAAGFARSSQLSVD